MKEEEEKHASAGADLVEVEDEVELANVTEIPFKKRASGAAGKHKRTLEDTLGRGEGGGEMRAHWSRISTKR